MTLVKKPGRPVAPARIGLRQRLDQAPAWTGVAAVLVIIVVALTIANPLFLTSLNLTNVLRGMAISLILALGSTLVIGLGMIDLSIGALLALSTMVVAGLVSVGAPAVVVVVGTMIFSTLAGLLNGTLIVKVGLPFLVVTLGTMSIFRSAASIPTAGSSVPISDDSNASLVIWLGDGSIGGFPVPVLICLLCVLAMVWLVRWTNFGRATLAVGGNDAAARIAGIRVAATRMTVFALNGLLVGLAGVMFAGRIQAGSSQIGIGIELEVIAAILLGGTSLLGGAVSMVGTFIGVLFVAVLRNGLNLLGVQVFWQGVVTGAVLILAVWIDRLRKRGGSRGDA